MNHYGDPCIFCKIPHDQVTTGECKPVVMTLEGEWAKLGPQIESVFEQEFCAKIPDTILKTYKDMFFTGANATMKIFDQGYHLYDTTLTTRIRIEITNHLKEMTLELAKELRSMPNVPRSSDVGDAD